MHQVCGALLAPAINSTHRARHTQTLTRCQYVTMKTWRTPARAKEAYKVASATDWNMITIQGDA